MVPPTLFGSVRYNVGDELCDGTADGTPCDDRDACTVDASCAAGRCVGGSRASCGGDIGHCREPGVCNPIDAACTAPSAKPYGTACEDGNVCTETHCDGGECVRTRGMDCNDANACTDDFCDAATGCRHLAVPGQCGAAGVSGTLAFVREVSADPDDRGAVQAFGPPDGPVFGNAYFGENTAGTVSIAFSTDDFGYQPFTFGAAAGERLGAGVYENATPFRMPGELRPVLSVSVPAFCYEGVGRFVVHEVTYGQATELVAFAADFEMACEGRRFEGAVRWRAGSTACHDAPDGTPCDDSNACTATSSCLGGACAGGGATVCAPTSDDCVETIACHPSSGACVAGATQDDLPCDAPDECIAAGVCRRGRCSTPRAPCDDANPCTIDRCEALDCVHDPIAGTCWSVRTQRRSASEPRREPRAAAPCRPSACSWRSPMTAPYSASGHAATMLRDRRRTPCMHGRWANAAGSSLRWTRSAPAGPCCFPWRTSSRRAGRRSGLEGSPASRSSDGRSAAATWAALSRGSSAARRTAAPCRGLRPGGHAAQCGAACTS